MSLSQTNATLHTVIIFTERMEELADFYANALDIGPYEPSPGHLGCQVGAAYFGFDQVQELDGVAPGAATVWFEVDDLQSSFARAVSLGATVRYPPTKKPWGAFLACVYDPDGNMMGLAERNN